MSLHQMYDFSILRTLRKKEQLSLNSLSEKSGISIAVISKLERNKTIATLETVYKLGRAFGMNPSDLLNLAENRSAQFTNTTTHKSGKFTFKEISYGNIRCMLGKGKTGSKLSSPNIHKNDYEVCWVLKGHLKFELPNETLNLKTEDAIQFDALLEHTYEALEDSEFIIMHLKKEKRF